MGPHEHGVGGQAEGMRLTEGTKEFAPGTAVANVRAGAD